jgi:hypothetical protein
MNSADQRTVPDPRGFWARRAEQLSQPGALHDAFSRHAGKVVDGRASPRGEDGKVGNDNDKLG